MNNPRDYDKNGADAGRSSSTRTTKGTAQVLSGKRSTAPAAAGGGWSRKKKYTVALSAIFGIIIGLGVTAAAGGTLYFTFQSQTDPFTASSAVELRNLNVVRDDDTLTVTGVLKNSGQTSISRLWIDNLAVSNLVAFQSLVDGGDPTAISDDLMLFVQHSERPNFALCISAQGTPACPTTVGGAPITAPAVNGTNPASDTSRITTRNFDGISMADGTPDGVESVLEGGRTQAFKIVITCEGPPACGTIDISRDVAISDRLTLTFGYASGDDILVSDAYSARVRSG